MPIRLKSSLTVVALLLAVLALSGASTTHVVLMHTNDLHGHLLPEDGSGGLAVIAAIVKQQRPDVLVDAGDMFAGTLLSDTFFGEPVLAVMNLMGYDLSVLGNHEFDFGPAMLRTRVGQAKFPILSANVQLLFKGVSPTRIVPVKGVRFGVIGLTTDETPTTTHPRNMKGIGVSPVTQAMDRTLPILRARSDFIIVVGHLRPEEETQIAQTYPEIRLIVSGHTHRELQDPIRVGNTTIVRTGSFGRFVGRIDLDFENAQLTRMSTQLIPASGVVPDPAALKVLEPWRQKIDQKMKAVLGVAVAPLPKTHPTQDSPLYDLVTDVYREKTGTQIALANTGGVRVDLPAGPITYGKVFEILPFENTLVTLKLTGTQLKRTLAVALTAVSGVRVVYDLSKPKNERLVSLTLADGSPVFDSATYTVTVNDFMLAGGDDYTELARGTEILDTRIPLRDTLSEYISSKKTISPQVDGRIEIRR
jgi:5'-nucleotidase/UDP-sugar diphosphatase